MLQQQQGVVKSLIDRHLTNHADDATHDDVPRKRPQGPIVTSKDIVLVQRIGEIGGARVSQRVQAKARAAAKAGGLGKVRNAGMRLLRHPPFG
ncbi:hypothetical protein ACFSTJ_14995 [Ottowia pentelensis]|uniref:hypothetical protein n=1 Tax=Ottowia pentelensis TaxID=511108 RepID=UPI0036455121